MSRPTDKGHNPRPGDWGAMVKPEPEPEPEPEPAPAKAADKK